MISRNGWRDRVDTFVTRLRRNAWRTRLAMVFAVIGPGFITANVDNDAGGIATYSVAGAQFGYSLLWLMIPITVALVIVQEMSSRMGAVTGEPERPDREQFGLRATFILMVALFATNFFNIVSEFAGVASSFELFGISKYLVVPVAALIVWSIVVHGTYSSVEKIFLVGVGILPVQRRFRRASRIQTGRRRRCRRSLAPRAWGFRNYLRPCQWSSGFVGTTIAPLDAVLSAGVGRGERHYGSPGPASRLDVIIGCLFAAVVAWFIVVACAATLHTRPAG